MSKFIKKIRKNIKHPDNCIVVGDGMGYFLEISELFKTVFVLNTEGMTRKARNVIYREDFKDVNLFSGINYIFIDGNYVNRITDLLQPIQRFRPIVYIGLGEFVDKHSNKMLTGWHYQIVEIFKEYQIWKSKI